MKTLVIYKSVTGFTEKYARWIAEVLSADLYAAKDIKLEKMLEYDCIIFGGRLYAVGIDGVALIKRNFEKLKDKRLIIFTTGASPKKEGIIDEIRDKNFTVEQRAHVQLFYFRGGFDYKNLPGFDKFLMSLLKKKILRKQKIGKELSSDEKGMLAIYDRDIDYTKKNAIEHLLLAARKD
ncbi:MAG TPA: flavodoxin [Clostridiales bacterium]|nr:flavodoxin [Clostridiales bacterium]